ncbi:hypothetical protein Echvi_3973 [Echinicola vietnamensis DSM 17526]|uniref:Uncharacterized protein n=1 Tax=Echinicola vietnamensis (strain DSM 17526 / LMG 23754 / KMM 6221) TaxID=926556 RepID=L0G5R5_ECHVK|nr:hypothetical protein Echvi_3973 [Echinicola vietnamensis DSM 17526]
MTLIVTIIPSFIMQLHFSGITMDYRPPATFIGTANQLISPLIQKHP